MLEKSRLLEQIHHVASRQWGHVTRPQLLDLGLAPSTIHNWIDQRVLIRVHAGVYALGHAERNSWARAAAAVLACGERAYLSHASALALFELRDWPHTPEVSSPTARCHTGIRHHRSSTLTPAVVRRHLNIPTTTPARAIHDVTPRLSDRQVIRLINDARLKRVLTSRELQRLLDTTPRARRLIDPRENPTRSTFEDAFVTFCAEHGLPVPRTDVMVAGHEVDALFPEHRVIVEIDSWRYHRTRQSFIDDRRRDLDTTAAGHVTVRLPDESLTPASAARLHAVLAQRSPPDPRPSDP